MSQGECFFLLFVELIDFDVVCVFVEDIGVGDVMVDLLFIVVYVIVVFICCEQVVLVGRFWFDVCFWWFDLEVCIEW